MLFPKIDNKLFASSDHVTLAYNHITTHEYPIATTGRHVIRPSLTGGVSTRETLSSFLNQVRVANTKQVRGQVVVRETTIKEVWSGSEQQNNKHTINSWCLEKCPSSALHNILYKTPEYMYASPKQKYPYVRIHILFLVMVLKIT